MLSTRSVCKPVTSAGGSGNAPDESEYCAFGLEYCRKCHPKGGGLQYLRLDSGQAQTTKKADVLALLDRNGGFPLPSGEPNLMVSTRYSHVRSPPLAEAATPPEVVTQSLWPHTARGQCTSSGHTPHCAHMGALAYLALS